MVKKYDEIDYKLLKELRKDCDVTIRELGSKLDVHPNTILKRIKRLKRDNIIIRNLSALDFYKLGFNLRAFVHIKVNLNEDRHEFIQDFIKIPQIVSAYEVTGMSDYIAIVQVKNKDDLNIILEKIRSHKAVADTVTNLMISCFKHPFEYDPL
jgi:DNA-binding Lrp family transcriptional regulator